MQGCVPESFPPAFADDGFGNEKKDRKLWTNCGQIVDRSWGEVKGERNGVEVREVEREKIEKHG